ncbi:MAG: Gfo/Idh/MocA family oxidoreductase [Clostridia bacterium]|nr:Gfo/Idh/MocA family oxidoreductase [Clostridia bacterium]
MDKLRLGVIGLGCRGTSLAKMIMGCIDEIDVVAFCDEYQDRVDHMVNHAKTEYNKDTFGSTNYKDLLNLDYVDAVLVATSWETHVSVSIDALKAGKITAMEVGGAYNEEELWELVDTYEATKTPFMFMENCCYGKIETTVTNMVRKGMFGKIVHCSGAYGHDLREEITKGDVNRHYRLRNYQARNGENYPTHELGPIAKILGINQGNKMVKLVSMASGEFGLTDYVKNNPDTVTQSLLETGFKQGDVVNTTIICENGESIALKLDTSLPRYYSREFNVQGTKGVYNELHKAFFFDGENEWNGAEFNNQQKYFDEYLVPIWKNATEEDLKKGHGGMYFFEFKAFADCALNNKPMPLDVYDAASWMVITCLSEKSIKEGVAVDIPDFTRGKYKTRAITDATELV